MPEIIVTYRACGCVHFDIPKRDQKEEITRAANGEVCPKCRAALPLADHLAKARAARSVDNLRAGMEKARQQKQLKPCDCGRTDGTHSYKCPVYLREAQRKHRTPAE